MVCEVGRVAAFEFIVPAEKEGEQLGRKSGSTVAQNGSLEEFNGPIEISRGEVVVCKLRDKGWSCRFLSWLKGGSGINPGCGCGGVGTSWV